MFLCQIIIILHGNICLVAYIFLLFGFRDNKLETLERLQHELDACQKSLNDYLDAKRNAFPRFFFISDDELLSILGSQESSCVQEHMIKMFDNVAKLKFSKTTARGMISAENEEMLFRTPVLAEGRVEEWMTGVLKEMRSTNWFITKEAIFCYGSDGLKRTAWVTAYQGMVVLAGSQVYMCVYTLFSSKCTSIDSEKK